MSRSITRELERGTESSHWRSSRGARDVYNGSERRWLGGFRMRSCHHTKRRIWKMMRDGGKSRRDESRPRQEICAKGEEGCCDACRMEKICIVDEKMRKGKKRMTRPSDRETGRMRKGDVRRSWRREERFGEKMGNRSRGRRGWRMKLKKRFEGAGLDCTRLEV